MADKALICGISGQDGAYLAALLLAKEYEFHGTSRDAQITSFAMLGQLGIKDVTSSCICSPETWPKQTERKP